MDTHKILWTRKTEEVKVSQFATSNCNIGFSYFVYSFWYSEIRPEMRIEKRIGSRKKTVKVWVKSGEIRSQNQSEIRSEISSNSLQAGVNEAMAQPLSAVGKAHFTLWCRRSVKGRRSFALRRACRGMATGGALHSGCSAPGKAGSGRHVSHA